MEGLKDEVVCRNNEIKNHVPFTPLSYKESIVRALNREDQDKVYTRWSDAYPPAHELAIKLNELSDRPVYTATYSLLSERGHLDLFNSICRIGGKIGWFHNNWMWRVRGIIDKIFFGVGSARGRKTYSSLQVNDVIDFWRVEKMKLGYQLLLRSEMKMPGKAWLEFLIHDEDKNHRLTITAYFDTKTFFGKVYWYFFMPFHHFIFKGLIKQIEKRS